MPWSRAAETFPSNSPPRRRRAGPSEGDSRGSSCRSPTSRALLPGRQVPGRPGSQEDAAGQSAAPRQDDRRAEKRGASGLPILRVAYGSVMLPRQSTPAEGLPRRQAGSRKYGNSEAEHTEIIRKKRSGEAAPFLSPELPEERPPKPRTERGQGRAGSLLPKAACPALGVPGNSAKSARSLGLSTRVAAAAAAAPTPAGFSRPASAPWQRAPGAGSRAGAGPFMPIAAPESPQGWEASTLLPREEDRRGRQSSRERGAGQGGA